MDAKALPWVCGGFTVAGLLLLAFGDDAEGRVAGAVSALFFGGGYLAVFALTRPRGGSPAPRTVMVGDEHGLVFPLGRGRQVALLVASLAVTAASIVLAATSAVVVGVLGAIVFGGFTLLAARGLARPRGLALTPTRIVALGFGQGEVAWDDVRTVGTLRQGPVQLIGIKAVNVRRGAFGRFNRRFLPADIAVPAEDVEALVRTVVTYLEQPERRPELGRTG